MMNVKRCDRCGVIYDIPPVNKTNDVRLTKDCSPVDLCPKCREKLNNWFADKQDDFISRREVLGLTKDIVFTLEDLEALGESDEYRYRCIDAELVRKL